MCIAGIDKCYVVEGEKGKPHTVQTDGINFHSAYAFDDLIDVDRISANDISAMREFYGVEAARSTIVDECRGVFGAYGIGVDPRHLGLISDHMTNLVRYLFPLITVEQPTFSVHHRFFKIHAVFCLWKLCCLQTKLDIILPYAVELRKIQCSVFSNVLTLRC